MGQQSHHRRVTGWLAAVACLSVLVTACSTDVSYPGTQPPAPTATATANVLVFLVDDMDDFSCADTSAFLPKSSPWLRDQGRCFQHASVTDPVCCPSRSVFMTSQTPHNNGVKRQVDAKRLRARDTLQHVLGGAGLRTYGTGKLLNGVNAVDYESGKVPSGFDASDFWQGTTPYDYRLWDDEQQEPVRPPDRVHATVRAGDFTTDFIASAAEGGDPFYAYVGFVAPHTDNAPNKDGRRFPISTPENAHRPVPRLVWNPEKDTSDKLELFSRTPHKRHYYERLHAARVRALYDVDDQMARILTQLEDAALLDDTLVVFTSDNGYHLGQNGWETKGVPYRRSIDVPLLIRYPEVFDPGTVDDRDVALIDLAPTIYDVLGLEPGHVMDGHSLAGTAARHHGSFYEFTAERGALAKEEDLGAKVSPFRVPSWAMYRWGARSYIEFYDTRGRVKAREFYKDRDQERNLLDPRFQGSVSPRVVARFARLLAQARTCAGTRESGAANPCP